MKLLEVDISGLFGLFDHRIPLSKEEPLTIIHGPNGIGKTTILHMIRSIFRQRFDMLSDIPFETMTMTFDGSASLKISRIRQTEVTSRRKRGMQTPTALRFEYSKRGMKRKSHTYKGPMIEERELFFYRRQIEEFLPFLERVRPGVWRDIRTGERLSFSDILKEHSESLPTSLRERLQEDPPWLKKLTESLSVNLIETQRLLAPHAEDVSRRTRAESMQPTVVAYADEMQEIIRETLATSAAESASLDRTFASRILRTNRPADVNEHKIRQKYREQLDFRRRLTQVGLLALEEPVSLPKRELEAFEEKVLWHYVEDTEKKLAVFDDLLRRLELLRDLINGRFLYKSIHINQRKGFWFEAQSGQEVPLTALSSGEQHEVVLAFALLFRVKRGALILIDEPEISLHVTWQHRFLDDLLRIANLSDLTFIVATHSPQIIHDRWDLEVSLGEGAEV